MRQRAASTLDPGSSAHCFKPIFITGDEQASIDAATTTRTSIISLEFPLLNELHIHLPNLYRSVFYLSSGLFGIMLDFQTFKISETRRNQEMKLISKQPIPAKETEKHPPLHATPLRCIDLLQVHPITVIGWVNKARSCTARTGGWGSPTDRDGYVG